ncbi:hypothetical protein GCM10022200_22110 [Microbacterium awajiense]|uniref:HTH marR-type domain-containing protein n=1 Tax=Microbacterium awajiense TaxID=415214 RepID=A0ABP7AQK8_9MICO
MTDDPADRIAAALGRLRGRRFPQGGEPVHSGHRHGHHPHGRGRGDGPLDPGAWMGGPAKMRLAGPARMRMLEALAAADTPLTVGQIAEAVGVDQPRASRVVQQSVELGLVQREADPEDARRTRVALTDQGRRMQRGFRGERRQAIVSALADFTDDEREQLAQLLTKLADGWPAR